MREKLTMSLERPNSHQEVAAEAGSLSYSHHQDILADLSNFGQIHRAMTRDTSNLHPLALSEHGADASRSANGMTTVMDYHEKDRESPNVQDRRHPTTGDILKDRAVRRIGGLIDKITGPKACKPGDDVPGRLCPPDKFDPFAQKVESGSS